MKACEGAETITHRRADADMEECRECGNCCRWDLVDHPFFGFKAMCSKKVCEMTARGGEK